MCVSVSVSVSVSVGVGVGVGVSVCVSPCVCVFVVFYDFLEYVSFLCMHVCAKVLKNSRLALLMEAVSLLADFNEHK